MEPVLIINMKTGRVCSVPLLQLPSGQPLVPMAGDRVTLLVDELQSVVCVRILNVHWNCIRGIVEARSTEIWHSEEQYNELIHSPSS